MSLEPVFCKMGLQIGHNPRDFYDYSKRGLACSDGGRTVTVP